MKRKQILKWVLLPTQPTVEGWMLLYDESKDSFTVDYNVPSMKHLYDKRYYSAWAMIETPHIPRK